MTNINFEFFLGNISFVILFLIMILYWIEAIFSITPKFNLIIFLTTLFANIALFVLLIIRWLKYGHFPLSNLYESLLFLSWSFTLIELFFSSKACFLRAKAASLFSFNSNNENLNALKSTRKKSSINFSSFFLNNQFNISNAQTLPFVVTQRKKQLKDVDISLIIGTILSPITLFTNSFAAFSLPKNMQKAQALVPALQSNWLMMHVTVMMLSYTALLCGSLLAITFLVITWYDSKNNQKVQFLSRLDNKIYFYENSKMIFQNKNLSFNESTSLNLLTKTNNEDEKRTVLAESSSELLCDQDFSTNKLAKTLDNLSYRILGIGFPLLTIGILSGAVWANEAWGSYWSWDPKETWAFITWLIFAIYLHTRITKGWKGKKPAILASFGFFIVWICYLGVNILGSGLHSYGWIQSQT